MQPSTPMAAVAALLCLGLSACSSASKPAAAPVDATGASSSAPAATAPAAGLQAALVHVAATVDPSVVLIQTTAGLGSGVVLDTQGDIVTNNHVAAAGTSPTVVTPDGHQAPATLLGSFAPDDLAVLRVKGLPLKPASFADSSKLTQGDIVMAVGNPLGLQTTVSEGIVSAVGRMVPEPGGSTILNAIQTTAAINPGNSGGALANLDGKVVGIPTVAATDPQLGGAAVGIGFAIPANTVTDIAGQIVRDGKVTNSHRGYLGVTAADILPPIGVLVFSVQPGGPAGAAGIKPGDVITGVDGKPVTSSQELNELVAGLAPGQKVSVAITHADGSTATVTVTVGQYPG
ncbi:MAG TPA: trypsin-like peptidase domain-containing protein [Actinomycetota bacterium]